jgi:hypothetical protein
MFRRPFAMALILGIGSLLPPRKSALCFQTENRLRIAVWRESPELGEVPVKARLECSAPREPFNASSFRVSLVCFSPICEKR